MNPQMIDHEFTAQTHERPFKSLEEVGTAYIQAFQMENEALFTEGDIVKLAVDQGFKAKDVISHCASLTRRQKRTVFTRYAVARTFTKAQRDDELCWYIHALCAATDNPHQWLEIASEGYQDAKGQHRGHTTRTLKAAIKASGGDPDKGKPTVYADAIPATLNGCLTTSWGDYAVELLFDDAFELPPDGTRIQVTIVQAPASDLEAIA